MASTLEAMASNLTARASTLEAMASTSDGLLISVSWNGPPLCKVGWTIKGVNGTTLPDDSKKAMDQFMTTLKESLP